jgi:K(+)-stimulated pyrophosphate-energized sodium pump
MLSKLFWIVPAAAAVSLGTAYILFRQMKKRSEGTDQMKKIASYIRQGAMAYLKQQYKVVLIVFICIAAVFAVLAYLLHVQNPWVPGAFITGGFFSALAGFFGMRTATQASARTANAARESLNSGLQVAFRSGAVMGLVVVGLALLDVSVWFFILNKVYPVGNGDGRSLLIITTTMLTFIMGQSTQALFARVGGGIFTKAADVGADLVGKVEADIPEDDPRNPATIADNVGDNVGDVAGMGADLYESYCGSIIATAALGAAAFTQAAGVRFRGVIAPMLIAAVGSILSVLGILTVRTKEKTDQRLLLKALNRGISLSSILIVICSFIILWILKLPNFIGIWGSIVTGLFTGIGIGKITEYFTSSSHRPTKEISRSALTGPATVIISGIGTGMVSSAFPVLFVVIGTIFSYLFSAGFDLTNISMGLYGIGIAAVGMLSTLGITLATDAYGPIADNAGGNAEMSVLGKEVRERTDALDALGNTTAATGKGFAIGSAALTALALLASYIEALKVGIIRIGRTVLELGHGHSVKTAEAGLLDFIEYYNINLMNPRLIAGMFIGSMLAFLFCGLTMNAVGKAAYKMVEEVRRQFKEIGGILEGTQEPDYSRCVEIATKGAQSAMLAPALIAILTPVAVGFIFGVPGVMGLLAGALVAGFVLAVFMANSGGAWDNAKKYIEEGNHGGKGSPAHKAAVIGDTVGDPFKDTSGPSLNILIKLMTMVSIAAAGVTVTFSIL